MTEATMTEAVARILPWPDARPDLTPSLQGWLMPENQWGLRVLVPGKSVIVEIGTHHGLSARFMADLAPEASVYCVDPWETWGGGIFPSTPEHFFASCWDYRDRLIPVRGRSPAALDFLAGQGVKPDLVYVDGDHREDGAYADIAAVIRLWPKAVLCGDDYATENPGVMRAVERAGAESGRILWQSGRFWRLA